MWPAAVRLRRKAYSLLILCHHRPATQHRRAAAHTARGDSLRRARLRWPAAGQLGGFSAAHQAAGSEPAAHAPDRRGPLAGGPGPGQHTFKQLL